MLSVNRYGQSGAKLRKLGPIVVKHGDRRVGREARWLSQNDKQRLLPHVYLYGDTWYAMEPLQEVSDNKLPAVQFLVDQLYAMWWSEPHTGPLNCTAEYHRQYIYRKLRTVQQQVDAKFKLPKRFMLALNYVVRYWDRLPRTLVHGDTTVSNLMTRGGSDYVFIDPGSGSIINNVFPSTPALDIGKLMYSALGYDRVRWGRKVPWNYDEVVLAAAEHAHLRTAELHAARYFCAMHFFTSMTNYPSWCYPAMVELFHDSLELL